MKVIENNKWYTRLRLMLMVIMTVMSFTVLNSCMQTKSQSNEKLELGEWTPRIGGCGGVFFDANKGPLVVEIEK